jgi:hypothetical protein
VDRPSAPKQLSNATGDTILTDGKISVVELARSDGPKEQDFAVHKDSATIGLAVNSFPQKFIIYQDHD